MKEKLKTFAQETCKNGKNKFLKWKEMIKKNTGTIRNRKNKEKSKNMGRRCQWSFTSHFEVNSKFSDLDQ